MNSRISAGSTVVDGGLCQLNSPSQMSERITVKKPEPHSTAPLTFIEPYQRPKLVVRSSPVGFENQSFSAQIVNRIRHLLHFCKSKPSLNSLNFFVLFHYSSAGNYWQIRWQFPAPSRSLPLGNRPRHQTCIRAANLFLNTSLLRSRQTCSAFLDLISMATHADHQASLARSSSAC